VVKVITEIIDKRTDKWKSPQPWKAVFHRLPYFWVMAIIVPQLSHDFQLGPQTKTIPIWICYLSNNTQLRLTW
jgi:hypothetical protein